MFAEYGARVRIDGIVDIPDDTRGTIVSDVPLFGHAPIWTIDLDNTRQQITMHVEEFDVTQSPSESAYSLTTRWSVDEALERIGCIVAIDGRNTARDRYTAALIFELYRLNFHAEEVVRFDSNFDWPEEDGGSGWESGTCREPDRDGGYWPQDDGYGYPVYRVTD